MRFMLTLVVLATTHGTGLAQQRTMNTGAAGGLRTWPLSGKWVVELVRTDERQLACLVVTGVRDQDDFYIWGLRRAGQLWSVVIGDRNASAVAGDDVKVIVDGTEIGDYPVTRRREKAGVTSIRADLPAAEVGRLSRLLSLGGAISLKTVSSTYSASLAGMAASVGYSEQCLEEAEQMEPAHS